MEKKTIKGQKDNFVNDAVVSGKKDKSQNVDTTTTAKVNNAVKVLSNPKTA